MNLMVALSTWRCFFLGQRAVRIFPASFKSKYWVEAFAKFGGRQVGRLYLVGSVCGLVMHVSEDCILDISHGVVERIGKQLFLWYLGAEQCGSCSVSRRSGEWSSSEPPGVRIWIWISTCGASSALVAGGRVIQSTTRLCNVDWSTNPTHREWNLIRIFSHIQSC